MSGNVVPFGVGGIGKDTNDSSASSISNHLVPY
jgi:hypothetical protein